MSEVEGDGAQAWRQTALAGWKPALEAGKMPALPSCRYLYRPWGLYSKGQGGTLSCGAKQEHRPGGKPLWPARCRRYLPVATCTDLGVCTPRDRGERCHAEQSKSTGLEANRSGRQDAGATFLSLPGATTHDEESARRGYLPFRNFRNIQDIRNFRNNVVAPGISARENRAGRRL